MTSPHIPYSALITRQNPTAIVFLLDQSVSMGDNFGMETSKKKCDGAVEAINQIINELVLSCTKSYGLGDYFYVGVIGFGSRAASAYDGVLRNRDLVPITLLNDNPLEIKEETTIEREDDGTGGYIEHQNIDKSPIWFKPKADGFTAMVQAFEHAYELIEDWVKTHRDCFPPIVINITDGDATDGNPTKIAEKLMSLTTTDGNVLLFNFHISDKRKGEILFPSSENGLPDRFSRRLFSLSSPLTPQMIERAKDSNLPSGPGSRGFGFNVSSSEVLIRLIQVGTTLKPTP